MPTINRRDFLRTAGAAAGAVALGAAGAASATSNAPRRQPEPPANAATTRRLRKAVMYGMVGEGSTVLEKFRAIRDAGFEGVELDSPTQLSTDEIRRARDETGVQIHGVVDSVHWRLPLSAPDPDARAAAVEALRTALRDCKTWGGSSVLLVPAVVNKEVSYAEAYERSQAEIRKVLPLAEELGVDIAIENVWNNFLLSPLEAARYIDELESPRARWHLDIGNLINFGWPEHWIRTLGARINRLHIKEFSRAKRDAQGLWKGFEVELLEGDNDWPAVMKALDAIGYEGWATAELRGGDAARLRQVAEQMDRIFAS